MVGVGGLGGVAYLFITAFLLSEVYSEMMATVSMATRLEQPLATTFQKIRDVIFTVSMREDTVLGFDKFSHKNDRTSAHMKRMFLCRSFLFRLYEVQCSAVTTESVPAEQIAMRIGIHHPQ